MANTNFISDQNITIHPIFYLYLYLQLLLLHLYLIIYFVFQFCVMITKGELLAFLGILNGMIGGTILVLPLIGIETGYILIPCVSLLLGIISFYSSYLLVMHLGQCRSLRQMILEHFDNRFLPVLIYNVVIIISMIGLLINYFKLILIQIQGFLPFSQWLSISVFFTLLVLTIIMRYLKFGEKLLAIGILSIVSFVGFLAWAYATAQYSPKKLSPTGKKYTDLGAALLMGYSIQGFYIEVLYKTTVNQKFKKVIFMVYVAGIAIYTFIAFGALAILNRTPRDSQPETISEYFPFDSWQVRAIEIIYLFHLLTASPEFCIVLWTLLSEIIGYCRGQQQYSQSSSQNFSQNKEQNIEDQQVIEAQTKGFHHISIPQFMTYVLVYLACFMLYKLHIKISTIIQINGSIIGFLCIFLMPIILHLKCIYFSPHNGKGEIVIQRKMVSPDGTQTYAYNQTNCKCKFEYRGWWTRVLQILWIIVIMGIGGYAIYHTLNLMFWQTDTPKTTSNQL